MDSLMTGDLPAVLNLAMAESASRNSTGQAGQRVRVQERQHRHCSTVFSSRFNESTFQRINDHREPCGDGEKRLEATVLLLVPAAG
jgi:hypothetical protein